MTAEEYCREKASPAGSNLYYSLLYQRKNSIRTLRALFAFYYELQEIIAGNRDPGISRIKLQWWHDEIEKVALRQSRHPIGLELALVMEKHKLDKQLFHDCIDNIEGCLNDNFISDYDMWLNTFGSASGSIWAASAQCCAPEYPDCKKLAMHAGQRFAVIEMLLNLAQFVRRGICPLPQNEMDQHKVTMSLLHNDAYHPAVINLFSVLIRRLLEELQQDLKSLSDMDKHSLLVCHTNLKICIALCKKIQVKKYDLLNAPPGLTPLRKLMIAWCNRK